MTKIYRVHHPAGFARSVLECVDSVGRELSLKETSLSRGVFPPQSKGTLPKNKLNSVSQKSGIDGFEGKV